MTQQFGVVLHPDLPPYLVHFAGRPRGPNYPVPVGLSLDPESRLASILSRVWIQGFGTFGTVGPVACVSEVSLMGLVTLFRTGVTGRGPYAPWAFS